MANSTAIEWTDATWNPVTGCTKISAGCDHCYAERFSERFRGTPGHPFETGFDLTLRPERLEQPLRWRTPRMIFVNSMSDLFHKEVPREFISAYLDTMERRQLAHLSSADQALVADARLPAQRTASGAGRSHMWFGVSIEDGTKLSRMRHLQEAPAGVRFLSIEPLIGPVGRLDLAGIDWVIVGGESGPRRPPHGTAMGRAIRDQCVGARVAFFFKQWGGLRPKSGGRIWTEGVEPISRMPSACRQRRE